MKQATRSAVASYARDARFEPDDTVRSWLRFRDLGVSQATEGKFHAYVTRAAELGKFTGWHYHKFDFQLIFCLKGWVKMQYEGGQEVTLGPGDSVYQPPGVVHNLVDYSEDMEILEIESPHGIVTVDV
jgi:quercetin dioxygenase-like cupin family protein